MEGLNGKLKELSCDVVIIGGGAAGMIAAMAALDQNARVTLVTKGLLGKGGSSSISGGRFTLESGNFSVDDHILVTLNTGCLINEKELVHQLSQQASERWKWLESKVKLDYRPVEKGYMIKGGGARFSTCLAEALHGSKFQLVEKTMVTDLLIRDGECLGCVGFSNEGISIITKAGATILATGGYSGIYLHSDNLAGNLGNGLALGARAGATLRDMEFIQFYPLGIADARLPTFILFRPFPPQARLVNKEGVDLLAKYLKGLSLNEAIGTKRDHLSKIIYLENEKSATYLDLTKCSWEKRDKWPALEFLSKYSFNFKDNLIRVSPVAHYSMGGLQIDENGQTSISRLYAAGEVTGGVHGANRLGGNALTSCLVYGAIAGAQAAKRTTTANAKQFDLTPSFKSSGYRLRKGRFSPTKLLKELKRVCWENIGIIRNARRIKEGKRNLSRLEEKTENMEVTDLRALRKSFHIKNGLCLAKIISEFALKREESRGVHQREDFPEADPKWNSSQFSRFSESNLVFDND